MAHLLFVWPLGIFPVLSIGGYESVFLSDLVSSYLFKKAKAHFYPAIYHGIYRDDALVVFKDKKSVR